MTEAKHVTNKKLIIAAAAALLIAAVCIGVWCLYAHYKDRQITSTALPARTVINSIDCSGMDKDAAAEKISARWNRNDFRLIQGGDSIASFPLKGSEYEIDRKVSLCFNDLTLFQYMSHFFGRPYEFNVDMKVFKAGNEFNMAFSRFSAGSGDKVIKPKDAYVDISSRDFKVVPEVRGNQIDKDKLLSAIYEAISAGQFTLDYDAGKFAEAPAVTADSREIDERLKYCRKYLNFTVTYEFGDKKVGMTPGDMDKIISVDEKGAVKIDRKACMDFVENLAARYNTFGNSRTINATIQGRKTITGGTYGYVIDKDRELKRLSADLKAGKDVSREPVYSMTGKWRSGNNDMTDTYVEVDLKNQHLWYYKKGRLIVDCPVVSGDVSKDRGTTVGTYGIAYKERNATLAGGAAPVKVKYWMPFNLDQGLHDAGWRDAFGGSIYRGNGSHGCVNIPPGAARTIYSNISAGDMVIVYY